MQFTAIYLALICTFLGIVVVVFIKIQYTATNKIIEELKNRNNRLHNSITFLGQKNDKMQSYYTSKLKIAEEALKFYASVSSWHDYADTNILSNIREDFSVLDAYYNNELEFEYRPDSIPCKDSITKIEVGGKLARLALEKIKRY